MTPKQLFNKFVNRDDVHSIQINGLHLFQHSSINESLVEKHLLGEVSLHVHCLNKDNKCKWGCIDIDGENFKYLTTLKKLQLLNKLKTQAIEISKLFPEFETLLEYTGNRGYHIWVFFKEPKYAGLVRLILGARIRKLGIFDVEIFPKQDQLSESAPYGSTVRLPLGIHPKSKKRSVFIK